MKAIIIGHVLNNKYDQILSFLYVKTATWKWIVHYFSRYLHDFFLNFVDNLSKDLTRKQIYGKIQSFHVNDLKSFSGFNKFLDNSIYSDFYIYGKIILVNLSIRLSNKKLLL
jgi:hypothetical protein